MISRVFVAAFLLVRADVLAAGRGRILHAWTNMWILLSVGHRLANRLCFATAPDAHAHAYVQRKGGPIK
jgi:hypothetical protein